MVKNTSIARVNEIISNTEKLDFSVISDQEWKELINSQSFENTEFLKNILNDMQKTSFQSINLQKNKELSTQTDPLFSATKISQAATRLEHQQDEMALFPKIKIDSLQQYQKALSQRLTEIRLKNHFYQHASHEDLNMMLGNIAPEEKQEKIKEFEFWQKVQFAQSHQGDKKFKLLSQALNEVPDSLKAVMEQFKNQLHLTQQMEKNTKEKKHKKLDQNAEEIIQKMIEFRDEKNQWFEQFIKELMEEPKKTKPYKTKFDKFILLMEELESYTSEPERPHIRKKVLELSNKLHSATLDFFKDPIAYVDPDLSLSATERNLKLKTMIEKIRFATEVFAWDNEDYAIEKTRAYITRLESQQQTATPEQQAIIQANLEAEKKLVAFLPIKKATREHLNPYIRIYNELGKTPSVSDLATVPIQMNEFNREDFKKALLCFAEMGEDGQFKLNNDPSVSIYYTTMPAIPRHILELEARVNEELGTTHTDRNVDAAFQEQQEKNRQSTTQTIIPPAIPQQILATREMLSSIKNQTTAQTSSSQDVTSSENKSPDAPHSPKS